MVRMVESVGSQALNFGDLVGTVAPIVPEENTVRPDLGDTTMRKELPQTVEVEALTSVEIQPYAPSAPQEAGSYYAFEVFYGGSPSSSRFQVNRVCSCLLRHFPKT